MFKASRHICKEDLVASRFRNVAVAALLLNLPLAACGDDDDSGHDHDSVTAHGGSGGSSGRTSTGGSGGSGTKAGSGGSVSSAGGAGGSGGSGTKAGAGGAGGRVSAGGAGGSVGGSGGSGGAAGEAGEAGAPSEPNADAVYAVVTQLSSSEESLAYLKTVTALAPQPIDLKDAREFTGGADAWSWNGFVYVSEQEKMTITKFKLEGNELKEQGKVNFTDYGVTELAFWLNAFISPTKAWVVHGTAEYIAWNPETMKITGTVKMPELAARGAMRPYASYTDRSTAVRDGLFYHPIYYTIGGDDYFSFDAATSIAVYDVKTDALVKVIEAPCPGIDHVTQNEAGDLFFSAWVFAPGGAALLKQPSTCVAKIAKGADTATELFKVKDLTGGLEGGVLRYTGGGKALIAVLDPSHAPEADLSDVSAVAWGDNWKFWTYDFETNKAALIENDVIGWNSGAAYGTVVDGKSYLLVGTGDTSGTTLFDMTKPAEAKSLFTIEGWAMRLIKLR
ncbi:MAG: hypothetical protein RL701_5809 [Pseudomonadota bacterium]